MGTAVSNIAESCTPNTTLDLSFDEAFAEELSYTNADRIIITIVNPCILAVGLLGNLAFLFMMVRVRRMWTVTNIYLTNLAIADTSFLVIAVSEKIARYRASPVSGDQAIMGPGGCISVYVLLDVAYSVGLCLVTLVTVEKYYAICRPIQHRLVGGMKRTKRLVLVVWVIAWVFGLTLLPCWSNFVGFCTTWPETEAFSNHPQVIGFCQPEAAWLIDVHNGVQTVPFFVCLIVNAVLYILIIKRLNTRVGVVNDDHSTGQQRKNLRQKVRNQVARMLIVNGVLYFTLMAPFQCTSFAFVISNSTGNYVLEPEQVTKLQWVNRTLFYLNPAINPYIYFITNPKYRQAYVQAFTFRRPKRRARSATVMDEMSTYIP
ncbi:growth hormone secretagogue receptor type 1-like [Patiria miniata]|uniref:G-protein coupled receptors family 1 profile domain-containing protein n=1 Tax=Patiria miniata TaxID=46514 RepID=A0A913ZTJ0_PATMI|nr:growth hormone secretagogue receptor type 1-like [Patiria miniata]